MARIKPCGVCKHPNPPTEMFCENCDASLATAKVKEAPENLPAEPQGAPGDEAAADPQAVALPGSAPGSICLCFPWGEEEVGDCLAVGRDPSFSRLWERCDPYDTVSGRHAELRRRGDKIDVLHLSRTNPTYVDGRTLSEGECAEASNGSRIAFSRALVATVRIE